MADMLEFTTTPKTENTEGTEGIAPFVFKLDGVTYSAVRPKDAVVAQIAPVTSRRTPPAQKVKLALDFLDDCLQEPGRTMMRERLLDPDDDLDAMQCMEMLRAIGEYWKANTDKATGKR